MYQAYITKVKSVRKHNNADRLFVARVFDSDVIITDSIKEDDVCVYFPTDGRLSIAFCEANNLLRKKDENGNEIGGYLDANKRNVGTIKLRGEKSEGLLLPLTSLQNFVDISTLKIGDTFSTLNGKLICEKYIVERKSQQVSQKNKEKIKKVNTVKFPFFKEHLDTSQYQFNKHAFTEGDFITISLKQHGTSARTSYTKKIQTKVVNKFLYPILSKLHLLPNPKETWVYVSGSRRVVLNSFEGGFYDSNQFREKYHNHFTGKLHKGETVYYEIVGYVNEDTPIMASADNSKTKDKDFIKQYGKTTVFSYGCEKGQNDIYVYRMTMTNEDGYEVEYSTAQCQRRCEEMGVKFVPVLEQFIFTTVDDMDDRVNKHIDGADPIGKTHIREGVVVRIENKSKFTAFKHKNFYFKVLENIIKLDDIPDMEDDN